MRFPNYLEPLKGKYGVYCPVETGLYWRHVGFEQGGIEPLLNARAGFVWDI